jgi:hypothetical protein
VEGEEGEASVIELHGMLVRVEKAWCVEGFDEFTQHRSEHMWSGVCGVP